MHNLRAEGWDQWPMHNLQAGCYGPGQLPWMGELGRWAQRDGEGQKDPESERREGAETVLPTCNLDVSVYGAALTSPVHTQLLISPLKSTHHTILPKGNSSLPTAWVTILRGILNSPCFLLFLNQFISKLCELYH